MEIACIVEGDGEQQAIPVLLGRIIEEAYPGLYVSVVVSANFRGRDKFQDRALVQRTVEIAGRRVGSGGAILLLLDADDDCPVSLSTRILTWANQARSDLPIGVVVANREYEAWFLAAAESLRGHRGLPANLDPPASPDSVRGAKEWLSRHMRGSQPYAPTRHQASFSAQMDLDLARQNSRSFRKLHKEVCRLVEAIRAPEA